MKKIFTIIVSILFAVALTSFNFDDLSSEHNKISYILLLIGIVILFIIFKEKE